MPSVPSQAASPRSQPNKWGPYANAGDFTANMIITLLVLFCGLCLAVAINAAVRFILCARRRRHNHPNDPEKQISNSIAAPSSPTLVYSTGTKLTGGETECAICLADFVEGDGIRVLPACNHGFHVQCIDRWLVERRSCPTCRVSCPDAAARG